MRKATLTLFATYAMLLVGCAAGTYPAGHNDREQPYQENTRLQWNSSKLPLMLTIDRAAADRTETGLLRVRLAIRNKTRENLWIDIRTVFTDKTGFELEKTNWEPFCCTARTVETYETVSLGSQAHDYQVIIRDPKESEAMP